MCGNLEESCSPSMNYKSSYLFSEYSIETVIKMIILFPKWDPGRKKKKAHRLQVSSKPRGQIPSDFKMSILYYFCCYFSLTQCIALWTSCSNSTRHLGFRQSQFWHQRSSFVFPACALWKVREVVMSLIREPPSGSFFPFLKDHASLLPDVSILLSPAYRI